MEAKMIVDALTATEVAPPPLGFAVVVVLVLGDHSHMASSEKF